MGWASKDITPPSRGLPVPGWLDQLHMAGRGTKDMDTLQGAWGGDKWGSQMSQ